MRAFRNRTAGGVKPQTGFALVMVLALVVAVGAMLAGMPKASVAAVCRMEIGAEAGACL